jgi:hypothetical protein
VREDVAMQHAGVERLKDMVRHEQEQARAASSQLHAAVAERQALEVVRRRPPKTSDGIPGSGARRPGCHPLMPAANRNRPGNRNRPAPSLIPVTLR